MKKFPMMLAVMVVGLVCFQLADAQLPYVYVGVPSVSSSCGVSRGYSASCAPSYSAACSAPQSYSASCASQSYAVQAAVTAPPVYVYSYPRVSVRPAVTYRRYNTYYRAPPAWNYNAYSARWSNTVPLVRCPTCQ